MLTIQPNFTTKPVSKVAFGHSGATAFSVETPEDEYYNDKTNFYKKQSKEFDNIIEDDRTPEFLRKMGKAFKIGSEVLFQGWLVAWGASKGAKFLKSSVISGVSSDSAKAAMKTAGKVTDGIQKAAGFLFEKAGKVVERVKTTPAYMNFAQKFENLVKRLDENKYGQYAMAAFRAIGSGIKKVAGYIKKPFVAAGEKLKNADFSTAYDKTAKAASTTLGVGAGATCAYDEIVHPENQAAEEASRRAENPDREEFNDEVQRRLDEVDEPAEVA